MQVNEQKAEYGQPTPVGERYWVRVTGSPTEIGALVAGLAVRSVEFTFEPMPDGEYEITVKADQARQMNAALKLDDGGELGISFGIVGSVAQSLGIAAVERENVSREQVIAYMTSPDYDEDELWTVLGPLIDKIEDAANLVEAQS